MEENQIRDTQIRDNRTLIGLLAIALAIYLGLTQQTGNIVNMKSELQTCMELTEKYTNKKGFEAWQLCIASYANS